MSTTIPERRKYSGNASLRLLRMAEVKSICGLSRSSIYQLIHDGQFSPPIAIGCRARAWVRHEVEDWVAQRISDSRRPTIIKRRSENGREWKVSKSRNAQDRFGLRKL